MTSTLCGPELAAVPVGAVELSDAPTAPCAVAAAAASRALSISASLRARVRMLTLASSALQRENPGDYLFFIEPKQHQLLNHGTVVDGDVPLCLIDS